MVALSTSNRRKPLPEKINIRKIKDFAFSQLPKNSTLRDIILSEEDEIQVSIFLARLPIWLKLLKTETRRSRYD